MTSFSLSHGVFVIERWCNSSLSLLTVKLIIKNALGINPSWLNQHDTCLFISNTHNPFIQNTLPQCCAAPRVKKIDWMWENVLMFLCPLFVLSLWIQRYLYSPRIHSSPSNLPAVVPHTGTCEVKLQPFSLRHLGSSTEAAGGKVLHSGAKRYSSCRGAVHWSIKKKRMHIGTFLLDYFVT